MRDTTRALAALALICIIGCGGGGGGNDDRADAAPTDIDARPNNNCGNNEPDPGEDCDDGDRQLDAICTADCKFTCGDGIKNFDEKCDINASGEGACPTSCDDGMTCTADVVIGAGCIAECVSTAITSNVAGDGCCLAGATYNDDTDCPAVCGNGAVEPPTETCDTAATGAGACPTLPSCNDNQACTRDTLDGTGCAVACGHATITTPANGDGCCPAGATNATDNDCPAPQLCGNGRIDANETCDIGITTGPNACPTSCNDTDTCTGDTLQNGGTCSAVCLHTPVTQPSPTDQCCVAGETQATDPVCPSVCGNGVTERNEQCDDANDNASDGCDRCQIVAVAPTAFRFTEMQLRDPHTFVSIIGCNDITDRGIVAVNDLINKAITMDQDNDGKRDFNAFTVFRPLLQGTATGPVDVSIGDCLQNLSQCAFRPSLPPARATATNLTTGTCLAAIPGTTNSRYSSDPPNTARGPCFSSDPQTLRIELAGIPITLTNARAAATYEGNPAATTTNGLLMGFISETDANNTMLPADLPLVGGRPLSLLLAGGTGNCQTQFSDKDTLNGVVGWWFYLNFKAEKITGWRETPLP
jgi:cysteine-rich repeat protein